MNWCPDSNHRRAVAPCQRIEGGDWLEKVEDDVRLGGADNFIELTDDARVFGQFGEDAKVVWRCC